MNENGVKIERRQLYKQVWSKPMSKLAKDYGISDVGESRGLDTGSSCVRILSEQLNFNVNIQKVTVGIGCVLRLLLFHRSFKANFTIQPTKKRDRDNRKSLFSLYNCGVEGRIPLFNNEINKLNKFKCH